MKKIFLAIWIATLAFPLVASDKVVGHWQDKQANQDEKKSFKIEFDISESMNRINHYDVTLAIQLFPV